MKLAICRTWLGEKSLIPLHTLDKELRKTLPSCTTCASTLAAGVEACPRCNNRAIFEEFVVDHLDRSELKQRLLKQRSNWTGFIDSLGRRLDANGVRWKDPELWDEWWREIQPCAIELGIKESRAIDLAEGLWQERPIQQKPAAKEPEVSYSFEPMRTQNKPADDLVNWVGALPDGRWDVVEWNKFLSTVGTGADEDSLRRLRDQEIDRQFAAFETVSVREDGTLYDPIKLRTKQFTEAIDANNALSLNRVPAGTFMMGSESYFHEGPVRTVKVSEFYLGRLLITQSQWQAVARLPKVGVDLVESPAHFRDPSLPVDSVSWPEASEFCARLAAHTGRNYRLPTESEWEYACRADSRTPFSFGQTIRAEIVNYDGSHPWKMAPVGQFRGAANRFGLHDMHGNLWEWCADEWHESYGEGAPTDGSAWVTSAQPAYRTLRGGAWCNWAEACRSSERMKGRADETEKLYYIGFRVALSL